MQARSAPSPRDDLEHPEARERSRRRLIQEAARRSLRRRRATATVARIACIVALAVALAALVAEVSYTALRGYSVLSLSFLTHRPTPPEVVGGGISTALLGSAEIIGIALVIAVPLGLVTALYLRESSNHFADAVRFAADVMTGLPSIVIGIFAYAIIVRPTHHFSDFAAAVAIAVLMLPIMIRANEQALRTVPIDLWEAGVALGARRSRVSRSVIVRGALPGLVVANFVALARGVGETAPLLFTVAAPTAAMTLLIYSDGTQAFSSAQQIAWGTAFVLLAFVIGISVAARGFAFYLTRKAR
jgi:phosphate transport system permease protein